MKYNVITHGGELIMMNMKGLQLTRPTQIATVNGYLCNAQLYIHCNFCEEFHSL